LNLVPKDYPTEGSAIHDSDQEAPRPLPPDSQDGPQGPPSTK
jgi:hypothetical protein